MNQLEQKYFDHASLMLRVLPEVMREEVFALKGGTAINCFFRDFPRYSVDIDLCYLPKQEREEALMGIETALNSIKSRLTRGISSLEVMPNIASDSRRVIGLYVRERGMTIKVEPNFVLRESVFGTEERVLTKSSQELFGVYVVAKTLCFADLYAGKLCAALDRQHPRDLFDVKLLLENEGITEKLRQAFLVYLISHNRPIHEVLNPRLLDFKQVFENEFAGMSRLPISLEMLIDARQRLIEGLLASFSQNEKEFLLSIMSLSPKWELLGIEHAATLPGVRWKLLNLAKMDRAKRQQQLKELQVVLSD